MDSEYCEDDLIVENHGSVRWLFLNRTSKMNSLDAQLAHLLVKEINNAEKESSVRALVLSGKGKVFCSGADLQAFQEYRKGQTERPDFLDSMELLNKQLRNFPKPTIAAVNGLACAGGLELVLCCDLVVAVESAMMGDAHINYAAFPGGGGASVLVRRIGMARAKYLLYTGELMCAKGLEEWGLLNLLVENHQELIKATQELANKLSKKSPLMLQEVKRVIDETENSFRDLGLQDEMQTLRKLSFSSDMEEGLTAFLGKRNPNFIGS